MEHHRALPPRRPETPLAPTERPVVSLRKTERKIEKSKQEEVRQEAQKALADLEKPQSTDQRRRVSLRKVFGVVVPQPELPHAATGARQEQQADRLIKNDDNLESPVEVAQPSSPEAVLQHKLEQAEAVRHTSNRVLAVVQQVREQLQGVVPEATSQPDGSTEQLDHAEVQLTAATGELEEAIRTIAYSHTEASAAWEVAKNVAITELKSYDSAPDSPSGGDGGNGMYLSAEAGIQSVQTRSEQLATRTERLAGRRVTQAEVATLGVIAFIQWRRQRRLERTVKEQQAASQQSTEVMQQQERQLQAQAAAIDRLQHTGSVLPVATAERSIIVNEVTGIATAQAVLSHETAEDLRRLQQQASEQHGQSVPYTREQVVWPATEQRATIIERRGGGSQREMLQPAEASERLERISYENNVEQRDETSATNEPSAARSGFETKESLRPTVEPALSDKKLREIAAAQRAQQQFAWVYGLLLGAGVVGAVVWLWLQI